MPPNSPPRLNPFHPAIRFISQTPQFRGAANRETP